MKGAKTQRLVYMGTAPFAVPTLRFLQQQGYTLVAVITQPDKPRGRGQAVQASTVKQAALELQLPVHAPSTLKDAAAHDLFAGLQPDMLVVAAYGKILPPWLIQLPRYGAVNLHGSLLPKYRGAAPIQWAIANGETETGVCAMQIDEGLDTGAVYMCERTAIGPDEDYVQLSERLAAAGGPLIQRTIDGIVAGTLQPAPQDHSQATHAPPLTKQHGWIDWREPAQRIHDRIRAFYPWPGAVTHFRGTVCKISKSKVGEAAPKDHVPGTIIAGKHSLAVACGDGVLLEVLTIQAPNRKPVQGADFGNGMRVLPGETFEPLTSN